MAEYVDKEALIRQIICSMAEFIGTPDDVLKHDEQCNYAINVIEDAPSADVAPVVHGRWDGNDCTVCKLPWNYNMMQDADDCGYFDPMPDYCPNCGAKMDEVKENAVD